MIFSRGASLEDAIAKLRALPGIGEWTAQYIAMRELREPDAFPAADIGLLRAMAAPDGRRPSPAELLDARRTLAAVARLCGAASVGRGRRRPHRKRPMRAKPPEIFHLDRLPTPIGTALLVTDADGVLRALDWEEHEPRMKELLRLQYGAVTLREARAPAQIRAALTDYFKGDLDRLGTIPWRVARHAVPAQGLDRAAKDSGRHHHELWRAGGKTRMRQGRCARSAMPTAPTRSASSCPAIA